MTGNTALENGVIAAFAVLVVQGFFRFLAQFISGRDKSEQSQFELLKMQLEKWDKIATALENFAAAMAKVVESDELLRKDNESIREQQRLLMVKYETASVGLELAMRKLDQILNAPTSKNVIVP